MAKYIRTKDGHTYCEKDEMTGKLLEVGYYSITNGSPIIAVADTIEELCDEFVLYNNILNHHKTSPIWWKEKLKETDTSDLIIYGAIWTDKGLIYVAKMNEKGELELL